jgi:hypothetical protein
MRERPLQACEINKISHSGFLNPGRINPGIYGVGIPGIEAGRVACAQRWLIRFR